MNVNNAFTTLKVICMLSIYLLCIAMVDGKPIVQRAKRSIDSPCFVLDQAGHSASIPVVETFNNLITRTDDLHEYVTDTRAMISERFKPIVVDYLETKYYLDTEAALINDDNKQENVANTTATMIRHYNQLYELVLHVEHIRTNGHISTLNTEAEMRARLLSIERDIYSIICTIKLGLFSAGVDTTETVTAIELLHEFLVIDGNYTKEFYRFFVVMADSKRLLAYLNVMYTAVATSLVSNENQK